MSTPPSSSSSVATDRGYRFYSGATVHVSIAPLLYRGSTVGGGWIMTRRRRRWAVVRPSTRVYAANTTCVFSTFRECFDKVFPRRPGVENYFQTSKRVGGGRDIRECDDISRVSARGLGPWLKNSRIVKTISFIFRPFCFTRDIDLVEKVKWRWLNQQKLLYSIW